MNYFDAQTWIGGWPFSFQPAHRAATLARALRGEGIGRALVSPLDAVFAPEPTPANRALLRSCRTLRNLLPVPVINPALANWREQLAVVARDRSVRAIRILPNYHNYALTSSEVEAFVSEIQGRSLRLVISMRLIDERHEYFAMRLTGVPTGQLDRFLERHPDMPVLASGLYRTDLLSLLPRHPNLLADLSFAEWFDIVDQLVRRLGARQLAFASHTPFLITAAALAKLGQVGIGATDLTSIAHRNLERFLKT
ncbi:hypothetical protein DB347_02205 [Opitutaceae bacterium EW11]|nr:hypothetical protein DB347_02205 [Opitutaceae bacterium EW11]